MSHPVYYSAPAVVPVGYQQSLPMDTDRSPMMMPPDFMVASTAATNQPLNKMASMEQSMLVGRLVIPDASSSSSLSSSSNINNNNINNNAATINVEPQEMSLIDCLSKLREAIALEPKFQPSLYLPQESQDGGEITIGTRDGAAHVLRCLKVWYELSNDVLFAAINLVDRFLTKMKVRPKHMACISVSSLYLAIQQLGLPVMDTEDLVAISQCRCTSRDLVRMSGIIANKLGVQMQTSPVTVLTFIRLYHLIFKYAAEQLGISKFYHEAIPLADLEMRAEILACDVSCSSVRPSELALVLIITQMDAHVTNASTHISSSINGLLDYVLQFQKEAGIPDASFFHSHRTVASILSHYNGQSKMPYKQRLVWKLSSRTLRVLRPSDKFTSYLPTIVEDSTNTNNNLRFRTGSVCSSDDDNDWPTSPVVVELVK